MLKKTYILKKSPIIILIIFVAIIIAGGCTTQRSRSDKEMFDISNEVYQDYLFEYGIDSALFSSPVVRNQPNGSISYKWTAKGAHDVPVGIEVIVSRNKDTKPEMILIGHADDWFPLVGSKNKKINTGIQ
jgi:hypothetical protein